MILYFSLFDIDYEKDLRLKLAWEGITNKLMTTQAIKVENVTVPFVRRKARQETLDTTPRSEDENNVDVEFIEAITTPKTSRRTRRTTKKSERDPTKRQFRTTTEPAKSSVVGDVENDFTSKRTRRTLATRTFFPRVTRPTITRRTYAPWTFPTIQPRVTTTTTKRTTTTKWPSFVFNWVQLGKVTPVKDQGYCGKFPIFP